MRPRIRTGTRETPLPVAPRSPRDTDGEAPRLHVDRPPPSPLRGDVLCGTHFPGSEGTGCFPCPASAQSCCCRAAGSSHSDARGRGLS